jgi:DNA polymerase-3 subunit delta
VKANKSQIDRALKTHGEMRFFLFHGPDEAGSRALAKTLGEEAGADAERIELSGAELKTDPARLPDEAASISLFGGARYIIVNALGDEIIPAVEALLEARTTGNPVAIITGALRPTSKLLKLALAEPSVLAFASYAPEGRDADRLVLDMAQEHGLQMEPGVARLVANATGGNRATIAQELAKFALYVDAASERPRPIGQDVVALLGAASEEGDLGRLVDSVCGGDLIMLQAEILRLEQEGIDGIPLIRAVLRRMTLLASLRAEVERGNSASIVIATQGKAIFWKEKDAVASQLSRWRSDLLARGIGRLVKAERHVKASGGIGALAATEELFTICRQATRLR